MGISAASTEWLLEFGSVSFCGGSKTGVLVLEENRKTVRGSRTRTNKKLDSHKAPTSGIEPESHWWETIE